LGTLPNSVPASIEMISRHPPIKRPVNSVGFLLPSSRFQTVFFLKLKLSSGFFPQSALSRSSFFERFREAVGVAPMEYLLAWRMALARKMLQNKEGSMGDIAECVGYGSASAFSVAFTRYVGMAPAHYAQQLRQ